MTEEIFPGLVNAGVQELVRTAGRLGLTWSLRIGTVTEATSINSMLVLLDADTQSIAVVSMIGGVAVDDRVYVISVPPAGNFAVGAVSRFYPGQRIATSIVTSPSAGFTTTEVQLMTVVAALVEGFRYKIVFDPAFDITVSGVVRSVIREDTVSGTILQIRDHNLNSAGGAESGRVEAEFTAVATGDKTFSGNGDVLSGGGTANLNAGATFPSYMYVDYISG